MKAKTKLLMSLVLLTLVALCLTVEAQSKFSLTLYKNNGYGLGKDMAGLWTLKTDFSTDTSYVEFYIDNHLQANDTTAPYNWQFITSNFTIGEHTLKAVSYNNSGESQSV
jgi:hypothetical protein